MARLTQGVFLARCHATHGDRYDLSRVVYTGAHGKIEVVCASHGSFFPQAGNFADRGSGCKKCGSVAFGLQCRTDEALLMERFVEAHGDRFSYNGILYIDSVAHVRVVCPVHGEFIQRAFAHASGADCLRCRAPVFDTESFILEARRVHGDKYDYSQVQFVRVSNLVEIVCPVHGVFKQRPDAHVSSGQGCRKCAKSGFKTDSPAVVYVYLLHKVDASYVGFGVTNDFRSRHKAHTRNSCREGFTIELIEKRDFSGDVAWMVEKLMKSSVEIVNLGIEGFKTEAANESSLPEILRILNAA